MDDHRDRLPPPGDEPHDAGRRPGPPAFNVPPLTLAFAGVLITVFGILTLAPALWTVAAIEWFSVQPVLVARAVNDPQPLRLLAAAFTLLSHALIHLDGVHLAVNTGFLLAFGSMCERVFGAPRYAGILVLAALAGAAAKLALDWNTPLYMIGASGAVFGCMGAFIRLLIGGPPHLRRRGLMLLFGLVVANLLFTLLGPTLLGISGRIAWDAHVGGFVAGFLLGRRPGPRPQGATV